MKKISIYSVLFLIFFLNIKLFSQIEDVSVEKFDDLKNKGYTILDVRTQEEFSEGYIQGAVLYNLIDPQFQKRIESLDKNDMYLVYCRTGNRSAKASNIMKEMGFKTVYNLQGGIDAWRKADKPIVK